MKRFLYFACVMLTVVAVAAATGGMAVARAYPVGGTAEIGFGEYEIGSLAFYSNCEVGMEVREGKLFAPARAVTKMAYLGMTYTDVSVSVTITAGGRHGRIDSGIFLAASNFGNGIDAINAWCVNVEREDGSNFFFVKLHRFDQAWVGARVISRRLSLQSDAVRLTATVEDGVLSVRADGMEVLTYPIGITTGLVGLRNFCAPVTFENMCISAKNYAVRADALQSAITAAEDADRADWTAESAVRVDAALDEARLAVQGDSQAWIDAALDGLNSAMERVLCVWNEQDADELLLRAQTMLSQRQSYIANTVASVELLVAQCESALESGDEEQLANWCTKLERRLELAVRYGGAV